MAKDFWVLKLKCSGMMVMDVTLKLSMEANKSDPWGSIGAKRGAHRPIMNLHERSLSVLAYRYVDEVIETPWEVSRDVITTFNISLVVHGTIAENSDFQKDEGNPYAVPISMGIFKVLESPLDITTTTLIRRIVANHEAARNAMKRNQQVRRGTMKIRLMLQGIDVGTSGAPPCSFESTIVVEL